MKKLATYEGVVENGRITLPPNAEVPDNTRVFVVVPAARAERTTSRTAKDISSESEIDEIARTRILEAWQAGKELNQIAKATGLSVSAISRYLNRVQQRTPYIASPRLADREQAKDFVMEVIEDANDAGL